MTLCFVIGKLPLAFDIIGFIFRPRKCNRAMRGKAQATDYWLLDLQHWNTKKCR